MSIARKILSNTFSQVLGKAVVAVLAVIVVKILSTYLGKEGYGIYATIYEYLAFFGALADFGLFTIAVKEMGRTDDDHQEIFGNTLTLRSFLTTISMLLAVLIAFLIPNYTNTLIPGGVAIAAIATWFVILSGTVSTVLQVSLKMHYHALALAAGKVVAVVMILLITQVYFTQESDQSFYLLIWAGAAGSLVTFGLTFLAAKKMVKVQLLFDKKRWRSLFSKAWPFGLALILNTIYFRLDIVLFSLILPLSPENGPCPEEFCADSEAGAYGVTVRMLEVLMMIPLFFMNSVLPILARHIEEKSQKLKAILNYSFYFLLTIGLASATGVIILARPIARLISSEEFLTNPQTGEYGSDTAMKILMIALIFTFLTSFFNYAIIAFGYQIKLLLINLVAVIFNLVANLLVIPDYGLVGAAITSVISEILIFILAFIYLLKITDKFKPELKTIGKIILSSAVMGTFTFIGFQFLGGFFSETLSLLLTIALSGVVFVTSLYLTRTITPEMLKLLITPKKQE
jgi:O-antigen/teichoic acid export membrane protein